ncbi:hypothetical protein DMENIID0001_130800 [Sergentomyia squamirostris]
MAESRVIRESVEEILARLHISGSIKDGKLSKIDLHKETAAYISKNKITNFTYADMPKMMLKYDFCYYMKKEEAHKSKYFNIKSEEVTKISLKYAKLVTEENAAADISTESEDTDDNNMDEKSLSAKLTYVTTVMKMKNERISSELGNQCFVCQTQLNNRRLFDKHMKDHGSKFSMDDQMKMTKRVNLSMEFVESKDSVVCKITTIADTFKLTRVALVSSPTNKIKYQNVVKDVNWTNFNISCSDLSNIDHPYTFLIFYDDDLGNLLISQYHITLSYTDSDDDDKPEVIKLRRTRPLLKIEKMKLKPLPDHYVSPIVKSLSRKNFRNQNLNDKESMRLRIINAMCKRKCTQEDYTFYWTLFSEIEECAQQDEMSKFDRDEVKLKYRPGVGFYILESDKKCESDYAAVIREGDKVSIAPTNNPKLKKYARIHQIMKDAILLDLEDGKSLDLMVHYNVRFLLNRTSFQMEREALRFVNEHFLFKFMLPSKHVEVALMGSCQLEWINQSFYQNPEQQSAVTHILNKTSHPAPYILMGPPGTGKTTTIVEAICQIIRKNASAHILVVASSNYACNDIAMRLLPYICETKIYRLFTGSKEQEMDTIAPELLKISNLQRGFHYYPSLNILKNYNVVICTLVVSGKFVQAGMNSDHFSYVFIDECGSCTEPSTLIPIAGLISSPNKLHGQVVISGDPKQLGPVIKAEIAKDSLGVSLLERLVDTGIYTKNPLTGKYNPQVMTMLLRNYRSHPKILEFPNKKFYSGDLMAIGSPENTRWACGWKRLPNVSMPLVFCHVEGKTDQEASSPSLFNKAEVTEVIAYIERLLGVGKIGDKVITQKCIGVISPYKKQCQKIERECSNRKWKDIAIGSVDLFQGQEKPIIIFSTVRSNTETVGFLNNPKRLNVALTRAQGLLIVVGNMNTLQKDDLWCEFIDFCKENRLIYEPPVRKIVQKPKQTKQSKQKDKTAQKPKEVVRKPLVNSSPKKYQPKQGWFDELLNLPDVPKDEDIVPNKFYEQSKPEPTLPKLPIPLRSEPAYKPPACKPPVYKPPVYTPPTIVPNQTKRTAVAYSGQSARIVPPPRLDSGSQRANVSSTSYNNFSEIPIYRDRSANFIPRTQTEPVRPQKKKPNCVIS